VRFSFPKSIGRLAKAASLGANKDSSRVMQFVAVAMLSAAVFVAAAYWQSGRPRVVSPTPAATAASVGAAATDAELTSRRKVPDRPLEVVLELPPAETEATDNSRELRRAPRPAPRVRPRKQASSADLKNPFR
jgi:hypothetical protein